MFCQLFLKLFEVFSHAFFLLLNESWNLLLSSGLLLAHALRLILMVLAHRALVGRARTRKCTFFGVCDSANSISERERMYP
jgi:hypothetical protein